MADIAAARTIEFASSARRALDGLARPKIQATVLNPNPENLRNIPTPQQNGPSRLALPDSLQAGGAPPRTTDISIDKARLLVHNALTAAYQIRDSLETLADTVKLAASTSLTSSLSAVATDGTRVSGVNIQAAASRITQAIDRLVANTETDGVNLISSSSGIIRLQTTEFGGRIDITPQPLDSVGLNIQNLDTVYRADAQDAKYRVDIAFANSLSRIATLETLAASLKFDTGISRNISQALSVSGGSNPRGSLVDLRV